MARKVKIYSDTEKGCIFFDGSTVEPKFIGTIIATAHPTLSDRVIIKRTDRLQADGVSFRVLFRKLNIARLQNRDAEDLSATLGMSRDEIVDYINEQANDFQGASAIRPALTDHPNFDLDPTSTSIIVDNGEHFGVNTIKAILGPDNLVDIVSSDFSSNNVTYFEDCPPENLQIKGSFIGGGPNDVVNALNELFTVGAFESVVISDPHATMVADVGGAASGWSRVGSNAIDPDGSDLGARDGGGINSGGIRSTVLIDQPGEYFTFDLRRKDTYGMGLIDVNETSGIGAEDKFCNGSGNYPDGYKWSQWLHSSHGYAWTMYGSDSRFSYGPAWSGSNDDKFHTNEEHANLLADSNVKFRVGIDANSYIHCDYYDVSQSRWVQFSRSGYAVLEGSQFALGIKFGGLNGRLASEPLAHLLEPEAPTMNFRYIESPDGSFDSPLFSTAEEANYFDSESGGSGESHQHVYVDDPTGSTWFMPDTGGTMGGASAPDGTETFKGNAINWTEITSLSNADLTPSAFSGLDYNVDELTAVNIQTQPQDTAYTTSITGLPPALTDAGGGMIQGTAPEVTGDNVANPSDSFTVTVTRTNSYGSSVGTFDLTVNNLTAPSTLPTGFTQLAGSFTDNGDGTVTVDNSSVVQTDLDLAVGKRVIIPNTWAEANVLPYLDHNVSESKAFFGVADVSPNWNDTPDLHSDFDAVARWEAVSATSHKHSMSVGDLINANHNTVGSSSVAYWSYAIEWDGTQLHVMRDATLSNLQSKHRSELTNVISDEPATSRTGALPLVVATRSGGTMNLTTAGLSMMDIPAEPVSMLTDWSKALDFSGSNEHLKQVSSSNSVNPIRMTGIGASAPNNFDSGRTSAGTYSRPWATAIVFKADGNNSNQHVWNMGQGSGSNDKNIYLRLSASRQLLFGWGRGSDNNECLIHNYIPTSSWIGIYVAHKGGRFSFGDLTDANLADAFDIRMMTDGDWASMFQKSTESNWTAGGNNARMDNSMIGDFTIGGRGSNRNFHGKVASMVVTTLRKDKPIPTDAEIELMVTDPKKWEDDYRIGNTVRSGTSTTEGTYNPNSATLGYYGTQIWLMGDGTSDNYSNGIRNDVYPSDQNYTKLQLNSMVSNDIQNVSIPGLS